MEHITKSALIFFLLRSKYNKAKEQTEPP